MSKLYGVVVCIVMLVPLGFTATAQQGTVGVFCKHIFNECLFGFVKKTHFDPRSSDVCSKTVNFN